MLIGGTTDSDADLATWAVIVDEWSRTDASYSDRIDHLSGTLPGGRNQWKFLTAATVHDDGAIDDPYGEGNNDWFIARTGDRVNDRKNGERTS